MESYNEKNYDDSHFNTEISRIYIFIYIFIAKIIYFYDYRISSEANAITK